MTDERKKYLASISKEERIIRELIVNRKRTIKHYKILMNEDKEDTDYINNVGKPQIAIRKFLIKTLKKQLPAPIVEVEHEYRYSYHCPICKKVVACSHYYCPDCGQKLR